MTLNRDHRINPLLEESKLLSLGLPTQGRAAEAAPARQGNGRRNTLYGTSGEGKINDQWSISTKIPMVLPSYAHNVSSKQAFQTFLVHKPCLVQRCFIKFLEPLLNPAPSLPAVLCTQTQWDEALRTQWEVSAPASSSSRRALKNKRFLFGVQGPFEIQKHCSSHLFLICLPFPPPSSV